MNNVTMADSMPERANSTPNAAPPAPPTPSDPRFSLELEFVLSLANPYYLSHLAVTYPNLLVGSNTSDDNDDKNKDKSDTKDSTSTVEGGEGDDNDNADARAFAAYLRYLYSYWSRPEYVQFLTHPRGTLRALGLLQSEEFRRAVIRPDVIEGLVRLGVREVEGKGEGEEKKGEGEGEGEGEVAG